MFDNSYMIFQQGTANGNENPAINNNFNTKKDFFIKNKFNNNYNKNKFNNNINNINNIKNNIYNDNSLTNKNSFYSNNNSNNSFNTNQFQEFKKKIYEKKDNNKNNHITANNIWRNNNDNDNTTFNINNKKVTKNTSYNKEIMNTNNNNYLYTENYANYNYENEINNNNNNNNNNTKRNLKISKKNYYKPINDEESYVDIIDNDENLEYLKNPNNKAFDYKRIQNNNISDNSSENNSINIYNSNSNLAKSIKSFDKSNGEDNIRKKTKKKSLKINKKIVLKKKLSNKELIKINNNSQINITTKEKPVKKHIDIEASKLISINIHLYILVKNLMVENLNKIENKKQSPVKNNDFNSNRLEFNSLNNQKNNLNNNLNIDFDYSYFEKNSKACLMSKCSEKEIKSREEQNNLSVFEIDKSVSLYDNKYSKYVIKAKPEYCIKIYVRSAADLKMDNPEDIRPIPVLLETVRYIVDFVLDSYLNINKQDDIYFNLNDSNYCKNKNNVNISITNINFDRSFNEISKFVEDRFRSVRQDLTILQIKGTNEDIKINLIISRFLIMCLNQCLKYEEFTGNMGLYKLFKDQLNKTLSMLRESLECYYCSNNNYNDLKNDLKYYKSNSLTYDNNKINLQEIEEIYFYSIILNIEQSIDCVSIINKLPNEFLCLKKIKKAIIILKLCSNNNYYEFFKLIASNNLESCYYIEYLEACLLTILFNRFRKYALDTLYTDKKNVATKKIKISYINSLLLFSDNLEAINFLNWYGIDVELNYSFSNINEIDFDIDLIKSNTEIIEDAVLLKSVNYTYIENKRKNLLRKDVCKGNIDLDAIINKFKSITKKECFDISIVNDNNSLNDIALNDNGINNLDNKLIETTNKEISKNIRSSNKFVSSDKSILNIANKADEYNKISSNNLFDNSKRENNNIFSYSSNNYNDNNNNKFDKINSNVLNLDNINNKNEQTTNNNNNNLNEFIENNNNQITNNNGNESNIFNSLSNNNIIDKDNFLNKNSITEKSCLIGDSKIINNSITDSEVNNNIPVECKQNSILKIKEAQSIYLNKLKPLVKTKLSSYYLNLFVNLSTINNYQINKLKSFLNAKVKKIRYFMFFYLKDKILIKNYKNELFDLSIFNLNTSFSNNNNNINNSICKNNLLKTTNISYNNYSNLELFNISDIYNILIEKSYDNIVDSINIKNFNYCFLELKCTSYKKASLKNLMIVDSKLFNQSSILSSLINYKNNNILGNLNYHQDIENHSLTISYINKISIKDNNNNYYIECEVTFTVIFIDLIFCSKINKTNNKDYISNYLYNNYNNISVFSQCFILVDLLNKNQFNNCLVLLELLNLENRPLILLINKIQMQINKFIINELIKNIEIHFKVKKVLFLYLNNSNNSLSNNNTLCLLGNNNFIKSRDMNNLIYNNKVFLNFFIYDSNDFQLHKEFIPFDIHNLFAYIFNNLINFESNKSSENSDNPYIKNVVHYHNTYNQIEIFNNPIIKVYDKNKSNLNEQENDVKPILIKNVNWIVFLKNLRQGIFAMTLISNINNKIINTNLLYYNYILNNGYLTDNYNEINCLKSDILIDKFLTNNYFVNFNKIFFEFNKNLNTINLISIFKEILKNKDFNFEEFMKKPSYNNFFVILINKICKMLVTFTSNLIDKIKHIQIDNTHKNDYYKYSSCLDSIEYMLVSSKESKIKLFKIKNSAITCNLIFIYYLESLKIINNKLGELMPIDSSLKKVIKFYFSIENFNLNSYNFINNDIDKAIAISIVNPNLISESIAISEKLYLEMIKIFKNLEFKYYMEVEYIDYKDLSNNVILLSNNTTNKTYLNKKRKFEENTSNIDKNIIFNHSRINCYNSSNELQLKEDNISTKDNHKIDVKSLKQQMNFMYTNKLNYSNI